MMYQHVVLAMGLLLATSAYPQVSGYTGSITSLSNVWENHPEEISEVRTCGSWSYQGARGFYRIVFAEFFAGGSRLWVQWMSARDRNGHTKALHTLAPFRFNEYHHDVMLEDLVCDATSDGITVRITMEDLMADDLEGVKFRVELRVGHAFGAHTLDAEQVPEPE
jgi:hypothetical protein